MIIPDRLIAEMRLTWAGIVLALLLASMVAIATTGEPPLCR